LDREFVCPCTSFIARSAPNLFFLERIFMRACRHFFCLIAFFVFCVAVPAQQRITGAIDSSRRSELVGNVPLPVRQATDLGIADGDAALANLTLRFKMTSEQQTALTQLLQDQQNPASTRYHQWLTPEQFGAQFGLPPEDLQTISAWLTGQGFKVTQIARGGMFLRFSGTVAQASTAFHTQLHQMTLNGQKHISNVTAPQLPTAIASVTSAITGLDDFHAHPNTRVAGNPVQQSESAGKVAPKYTSSDGTTHSIAPGDFYTIYDENPLLSSGLNGSGVSIAVMGQSDIALSDIAAFRAAGGLAVNVPTQILYGQDPGFPVAGDQFESELDLEWAGATAPSANIIFVRGPDVFNDALTGAIDNKVAPIISIGYGACETDGALQFFNPSGPLQSNDVTLPQSSINSLETLLQMANAQGQTIVAAAGDGGAAACDFGASIATHGMAVAYPASSSFVTAIGGTEFNEGSGTYWSATNGANSGSALSYIPEQVWNDSAAYGLIYAGGGGSSVLFVKPYWQQGTGTPADFSRDIPDLSLNAGLLHDSYLGCVGGCTNGYEDSSGVEYLAGGTSMGAPTFAGLLALLEQKTGQWIGNINPTIYALANSSYSTGVFHDVTTGSNAVPCAAGTPDCPASGSFGYAAGVGYDLATGWGSVDAFNLINDWSLVTPVVATHGPAISLTTLSGTPIVVAQSTMIDLTATVAPASGLTSSTPTGAVQFLLNNTPIGGLISLNGAAATYQLDTTNVPLGINTVQAVYSGDATFAGSKGAFGITVTGLNVASKTSLSGTPGTTNQGQPIALSVTVASASSSKQATPTGTIQFLVDNVIAGAPVSLTAGALNYSLNTSNLSLGSHTVTAVYSGDATFAGSSSSFSFMLTGDFTLTPTTTTLTVNSGATGTVPFTIQSLYGFTGMVQVTANIANASFSPSLVSVTPQTPGTATLTLFAYNVDASVSPGVSPRPVGPRWYEAGSATALAGLFLLFLPKRKRFARTLALLVSIAMVGFSGCAGGGGNAPTGPGAPTAPGTYTVTVTASGNSGTVALTHTATVTLIVVR
jgi:subtilase family serine protease